MRETRKQEQKRRKKELLEYLQAIAKLVVRAPWARLERSEGKLHKFTRLSGLETIDSGKRRITLIVEYTDSRRNPK
jgi:hypothetical protein